ncbi:acyl-CoA dehydrogenase family protein [Egicoccus halophilus]|uniref:Acyl-[acyl-carrier-protein] dehydrogenase MbtN n=1 Tax=Egicoccus halophilus TaxID=1670830 RepID=A0A8J3EWB9_9ACTN|nr:acyl-CoA dehydrogenase family protein [Egicoccus halophilus]GGI03295.1 acyl-CoA dehydrogenase [Egicoccus halophilus]
MERRVFTDEHEAFRATVARFVDQEVAPHHAEWERDGLVPRELWKRAGALGLLCTDVPEAYGGGGVADFRYNAVVTEELSRVGASGVGFPLHNDVVVPYLLAHASDEQRQRWLPAMAAGETISAIAMTEPGTGSDLAGVATTAMRQPDGSYRLDGAKTFITNGILADLVLVVAKTDPAAGHGGMSLLVVEEGMPGFTRGRKLEKIGLHAQDTAELFFDDVRVPADNLLGEEGHGFAYLMQALPQERLSIAIGAIASAAATLAQTVEYCRQREAFGRPIGSFQHSRFVLAELHTEVTVGQQFVDRCLELHTEGRLTVDEAAMAKFWTTELLGRVVDRCVQLHGGYGYMREYPVARAYVDARVQRIYGGTNEIMQEIIGRSMGL